MSALYVLIGVIVGVALAYLAIRERIKYQDALRTNSALEFKNLANEIFEEKTRKFTEQNKENLTAVLYPLNEKIREFQKTITESYLNESREMGALSEQIRQLASLNQQITKEASNLTTALRGQSKTQGDWGEQVLDEILERSGLEKGIHYTVQEQMKDEDGKVKKPDVIINLPEGRHIIIDSKVSLVAYTDYSNEEDAALRQKHLSAHVKSIREHIRELGQKNYQNLYQLNSPDFVLMFVPIESAYLLTVKNDAQLFNEAYERRVVIVTASTLLATLMTVARLWRHESQNKNALEIARKSGELYDKFVSFVEDLKNVGEKLNMAQKSYDDAMNKLKDGRKNLIKRAEELKSIGAQTTKSL